MKNVTTDYGDKRYGQWNYSWKKETIQIKEHKEYFFKCTKWEQEWKFMSPFLFNIVLESSS